MSSPHNFMAGDTGSKLQVHFVHDAPGLVTDAAPAAGSFKGDTGLSSSDDAYNGCYLRFLTGQFASSRALITDYTGSTRLFTLQAALANAPLDGDRFLVESAAFNLTGKTPKLRYRFDSGVVEEKTMTTVDAADGYAEYQFATGELQPGSMECWPYVADTGTGANRLTSLSAITLKVGQAP